MNDYICNQISKQKKQGIMEREIKFKAKRVDNGEWVESKSIIQCTHEGIEKVGIIHSFWYSDKVGFNTAEFVDVLPETVCQFTGLKDKNGVDIYDDDILSDVVETDEGQIVSRETVFWSIDRASFRLDHSFKQDRSLSSLLHSELKDYDYEVVGNIHD